KSKRPGGLFSRLPALQVTDDIGFRSLLFGFPFMTAGLLAGLVIAQAKFDTIDFRDPKILFSLLTWAVYLILLYTRWSAGWRGRRAAYLAAGTFALAIVAWRQTTSARSTGCHHEFPAAGRESQDGAGRSTRAACHLR